MYRRLRGLGLAYLVGIVIVVLVSSGIASARSVPEPRPNYTYERWAVWGLLPEPCWWVIFCPVSWRIIGWDFKLTLTEAETVNLRNLLLLGISFAVAIGSLCKVCTKGTGAAIAVLGVSAGLIYFIDGLGGNRGIHFAGREWAWAYMWHNG